MSEPVTPPPQTPDMAEPLKRQMQISAVGEICAFSLAIGAVYVCERVLPRQTEAFTHKIADLLARCRGTSAQAQTLWAKKILAVGIMNLAGAAGMATQFGIRRAQHKADEKMPLGYEFGRLIAGRLVGTVAAISALTLMETKAAPVVRRLERFAARGSNARFAELLVSNSIQTAGAVVGNAPAQLLYDCLVNPPQKNPTR